MQLDTKLGLSPGRTVLDGDPAGWIKMSLGEEIGLGPGHLVLDGKPAPRP